MLGDDIEKITKVTGVKKIVDKVSAVTKKPCGCKKRKKELNDPNLLINKLLYKPKK